MKPRFVDSFLYAAQGIRTAVLVFSIGCAVCGAVLFWDVAAFRRMFAFFAARPLLAVLLAASLAVAWQFIFGKRKEGK